MRKWPLVLLFVASSAWALKPQMHRNLAESACTDAGLPGAFCHRMGKAVYEVDYYEWDALSAHAQRERGQDRCTAADLAISRVDQLARAMVADATARKFEEAAVDLGRAMHTLQDECAHHGMTNEEHAFFSLVQTCTGEDASPDVQPAAIACAQTRTREAMTAAAAALAGVSWNGVEYICRDWNSDNNQDKCELATLPTPRMVCTFLRLHTAWDGADSTWDGARVGSALTAAFAAALAGENATRSACSGDLHAIDPPAPHPTRLDLDAGCTLTDALCLGKVDDGGDDDPAPPAAAGCNAIGAPGLLLALLTLRISRSGRRKRSC